MQDKLIKSFYETLFTKDEYTCFTDAVNARNVSHARRQGNKADLQYFSINPITQGKTRSKHNVSCYKNILIEIDQDLEENKIPRDVQKKMLTKLAVPYSTLVWSAGKSYHAIISLTEPFEDIVEYEQAVKAVYRVLQKNKVYNDESVKDAARLSRAAGAVRIGPNEIQEVEAVRSQISRSEFDEWLDIHDEEVGEVKYHDPNMSYTTTSEADDDLKFKWVKKYYMNKDQYIKGKRHNYQVKMAYCLALTGMHARTIEHYFIKEFGEVSTGIHNMEAFIKDVSGDPIYVPTMKERRSYMKKKEEDEKAELVSDETVDFLTNRDQKVLGESLNEYILVGNDFYWVDPQTNLRRKRNDRAIRARFPGIKIHEIVPECRVYKAFDYLPSYHNYQRNINGYYNTHENFNFEPAKGEWPDIERHLKHLFGNESDDPTDYENQYNEIIEWFRVAVNMPTHPLWAIVLTSKEHGVGKNILAIMMKMIFGQNYSPIRRVDIENDRFNSAFAENQLCFIDEFEKVKDPVRAYGMFKEMVTATEGIRVERKGEESYEVPFYSKFLFAHNASRVGFPGIEAHDRRFWIRQAYKPNFVMDDAYVNRIREQIPAFVYFLLYEAPARYDERTPEQGALWIPAKWTWTIWLDNAKESNRSFYYHKLMSEFDAYFQDSDEDVIYTTARSLALRLNTDEERNITHCLRDEFNAIQDSKITRRKDFITGQQPKNGTKWYHITKEMVYGKENSEQPAGDLGADYFKVS